MNKFSQKDYILYKRYYDKILNILKKELERIKKEGKKTLWFYGAQKTYEHLRDEEGKSLTPRDVDNIIFVLADKIQKKK